MDSVVSTYVIKLPLIIHCRGTEHNS